MTIHNRAMHASASYRGLSAGSARNDGDVLAIIGSVKAAFEEFKVANDARLKEVEKGKADPLSAEKVDRINNAISEMQAEMGRLAEKAAANELGGAGGSAEAQAAARDFSRIVGSDVSAEDVANYSAGLDTYMRVGADSRRFSDARALMEVGSDPNGGYTVTPDMNGRVIRRIFESSPARQLFSVVAIGTDRMEGPIDRADLDSGWVGEKQPRNETGTPGLGKWEIPVFEQYAMPKVTQKILDDANFDVIAWLSAKVADKFARVENTAFFSGTGVNMPRGILTYNTAATADKDRAWQVFEHVLSGANTTITDNDQLIKLVFALKAAYRTNASWTMNRKSLGYVRTLKDGQGNYIWQPDFAMRQGGTLLGYGITEAEDMPDMAANALSIGFGDFAQAYQIVDRAGIYVLRDPYTEKPFVKLYTTKRVGGDALDFEAAKFMKFAAA